MVIDVFPFVMSLVPLATYLILLGAMRLTRRPLVTTSARDTIAVAIAVSGFVMIGPVHLFFPSTAAAELGGIVWIILAVFYVLCVSLIVMSTRPRIIIYGLRPQEAIEPLLEAAQSVDPSATADRERSQVTLNDRNVHLRIDPLGLTDAVQIEAFEHNLHPQFWRHLLLRLRYQTHRTRTQTSIGGMGMLIVGIGLMIITVFQIVDHSGELLASFREWIRI